MRLSFYTTAKDGQITIIDPALLVFGDKRLEVVVSVAKKRRSNPQNAYLWSTVYPYALQGFLDAGWEGVSKDEVHGFFKKRFLDNGSERVDPETGEVIKSDNTTTTLSTTEMMTYLNQIIQFSAEFLNTVIPEAQ